MSKYQPKLISDEVAMIKNIDSFRETVITKELNMKTTNIRDDMKLDNLFIPPYQRPITWTDVMQSTFIESLILGLPIPYVFLCENNDGRLEVVDGSQRLRCVSAFLDDELRLRGLEKLSALNDMYYSDLPESERRKLNNLSIVCKIFSDRTDPNTRFDIFKRLNSGGKELTDSQKRAGSLVGQFYDIVLECASNARFVEMSPMHSKTDPDGDRAELVTRFFCYAERYLDFRHDVREFLNAYVSDKNKERNLDSQKYREWFDRMVEYVDSAFPYGFRRAPNSYEIPRVRFEALSVGVHLAIESGHLDPVPDFSWLESKEFKEQCRTDASNSGTRLRGRVEYVRDRLVR